MSEERELAIVAKSWPFEEARRLLERNNGQLPAKGYVLFETGYGPSGLPHIGTFGEVARTTMVRHALATMTGWETRLIAFSDDMDGLRKVPDNIPNKEMVEKHLGKPLTRIPDPFGTHESFGHHNNARLKSFLDSFGFDYEFMSATECYKSGVFNDALLQVLDHYDEVMAVILPTLGAERQATYSPFLPLCPKTGEVLQVPILERDTDAGTIVYQDADGGRIEVPVTDGNCKLQWKADWAMRWHALGVDYEMSGKDLIDSVKLSGQICRILGSRPPDGFNYELFLDENGEKISKSKGNGLSVDEWLAYAPPESLALFMYQQPRRAKRLYFDAIPKAVDDYFTFAGKYLGQTLAERLENPVWHILSGKTPESPPPLGFSLLLNLVTAANTEDRGILWGFIGRYVAGASPESEPELDRLVDHAIVYFHDFVKPTLKFRAPTEVERGALEDLLSTLEGMPEDTSSEAIQSEIYEIGKRHAFKSLREWFGTLYEVLLGQSHGPRMGSFVALYGIGPTCELIRRALTSGSPEDG